MKYVEYHILKAELESINSQLDKLLKLGSNDEKLVNRKRELEKILLSLNNHKKSI